MTRSVSMRPEADTRGLPVPLQTFLRAGFHWQVVTAHAEAIESAGINWFDLASASCAERIKQNSRRDVWKVRLGDRSYFAKVYSPGNLLSRLKSLIRGSTAEREWAVGIYAASHDIAAVVPVATATSGASGPSLLITEAVTDVEPLNDHWLRIREDRLRSDLLSDSLARLIARAHQCGFRHGDMHPGNILVRRSGRGVEAMFVDLHNVRIGRSVTMQEVVANLAQLHQWFRRHSNLTRRRRFLERYIDYRDRFTQSSTLARSFRISPREMIEQVALRAEAHAERLWSKRDRRADRSGTYFARIRPAKNWRGHALLQSKHPSPTAQAALLTFSPEQWSDWLRAPLDWVDPRHGTLIKDSHTATICKALLPTDPPATVIVKRPLARNLFKRIGQFAGLSRNMRAWQMANRLLNRDLPVAQPLAVVERYALGFIRTDSIALTDYIPDSVDLETFLTRDLGMLRNGELRRVKDELIEALVRLIRTFHHRGFSHRDFKAGNLLVNWKAPYAEPPRLTFIDMDGIRYVRRVSDHQQKRALVRLCVSVMNSPICTRTDLLRFLKRDLTRYGRSDAAWKNVWRSCELRVFDKQRHKAQRRDWKMKHYGRE